MAVIVSESRNAAYDGNLSTANGFYRAEAYNLGAWVYNAYSSLATVKYITTTFANAGNCQGVIICLYDTYRSVTNDRSVTVELQENVASVWTTRATVTLTASQICGGSSNHSKSWIVPFDFATPYAVTTAAATWRFSVIQTGGTVGTWYMSYSETALTNPFYITWCDNQVSFANDDCLIVKDKAIIDQSATVKGVLGTGITNYATAGVICRSSDLSKANTALLEWENPPAASYTFAINGQIMFGSGSGFRIGTSANKIPYAQQAIVDFIAPTVGTIAYSAFQQCMYGNGSIGLRSSYALFLYGESPTITRTTLAADAATGQPNIVTSDSTGWAINDIISIGKEDNITATNCLQFTIQNIVGTAITLTANLGAKRISGAPVYTYTGYGIKLTSSSSASSYGYIVAALATVRFLEIEGVYWDDVGIYTWHGNSDIAGWMEDAAHRDNGIITKCVLWSSGFPNGYQFNFTPPLINTTTISYVNMARLGYYLSGMSGGTPIGRVTFDHCIWIGYAGSNNRIIQTTGLETITLTNNIVTNWASATIGISCINPIITDNYFYGTTGGYGAVFFIAKIINDGTGYFARNHYDRCGMVYYFYTGAFVQYIREHDSIYGAEYANTNGITVDGFDLVDFHIHNNTGAIATNLFSATQVWPYTLKGAKIRFTDYGGVANTDNVYSTYGNIVRTGDALADTTVHTPGSAKYAMRFQPVSSTDNLDFPFTIPTGNIQGKTMTVAVWCKINNAAFYGGTHEKPRLTVNYDNGTIAYVEALGNTDWQLIPLTFSPTTTYGEIAVTLSCRTDQTGSNAYVYWDDFATLFPGGYSLDTQGMDLWAKGYPVTPPLATVLSAKDVWAASALEDYGANTMGNLVEALPAALAVVDGIVDDILEDTGTTLSADIATVDGIVDDIKAHTDTLKNPTLLIDGEIIV